MPKPSLSRCFVLITLILSSLTACKEEYERTKPTIEPITESVYASGSIKSKNQYQVFATVNGLVKKIMVKEGDVVEKGTVLLYLENQAADLSTENARLATELAEWNKNGARLSELEQNIQIAKAKLLNDSLLYIRQKGLWEQSIGSKVELEQRKLAFETAQTAYASAQLRYVDLKKQLDFAARQSQKMLAINQSQKADFVIRSQAKGRVYNINKEVGEIVSPQTPIAIIGDAETFVSELQIDENDIVEIKIGQQVLLTLDSYRDSVFEATISQIYPIMNERTRTFTVQADFVKQPSVLYPNLTTEANIILRTKERAMTIPRRFLLENEEVLLENKEKRRIETGLKDYQKVEVLSGLDTNTVLLKLEE